MRNAVAPIRLPGVYFLPAPRAAGQALPRLDIAAFVGFAERGPLDVPVPVEDLATFRAIFGERLPIAREADGQTVYAYLADAVAAFFNNGGRRCYVVRVASKQAQAARFRVPGLISLGQLTADQAGPLRCAALTAATPGRWSEQVRLAARLRSTPLPPDKFTRADDHTLRWHADAAPDALKAGDVLRLTMENGQRWLAPIAALTPVTDAITLTVAACWQVVGAAQFGTVSHVAAVRRLTTTGTQHLSGVTGVFAPLASPPQPQLTLTLYGAAAASLQPGEVLSLQLADNRHWLATMTAKQSQHASGSPSSVTVQIGELLSLHGESLPIGNAIKVERLRFDLVWREAQASRPTLEELAFNAPHERFWGETALLASSRLTPRATPAAASTDSSESATARAARLFRTMHGERRRAGADELPEAAALAGTFAPLAEAEYNELFLPFGMPALLTESEFSSAEQAGTDGLATFDAAMFLDSWLDQQLSGEALLREAFDRHYVQERRLYGLHSLLFIDEVALVALPDAVHRPWRFQSVNNTPVITSPPAPPALDRARFDECELSAPVAVPPAPQPSTSTSALPTLDAPNEDATTDTTLLTLHTALVKSCAGRADAVAILTLPRHYDKRRCLAWQSVVRERLGLPPRRVTGNDARGTTDLSYAAVYHPWLFIADANAAGRTRAVPCDGAVCGLIAARERARQVWVAPANQPLQNVLGLTPAFSTDDWAELFALQFNLLRPQPQDFRILSAHTLSDEQMWLQLSVRRLLIQLRKAAAERGMDYVFENNSPQFREGVRVGLESLLRFMFQRGAFAGANEAEAFRVITDARLNPALETERGRFIAQIQVAPAQPLEFITVLLTRVGEAQLSVTES